MNLNKESKQEISQAIGDLYRATRRVNILAGNESLDKNRFGTQLAAVEEEMQELIDGYEDNNLGLIIDATIDSLVTVSELISIIDGNDSIIQDNPIPKHLNLYDRNVEQLINHAVDNFNNDNYIDLLGNLEDLCVVLNCPICENIYSVIESNNSKFITVKELDESTETEFSICEAIESEGRYEDVYSETVDYQGEEYIVFKSKYDKKNDKKFTKGKFVKPLGFFKEPTIVVYG